MGLGSAQMPRYFSAKPPALVTRFGTGTYLGASLERVDGQVSIKWDEERIVAISDAELSQYLRDYAGLVRDGSLIEWTEDDYKQFCEADARAAEQAHAPQLLAAQPIPAGEAASPSGVNDDA